MPFFLQNSILHGVFVAGCAIRVIDKGYILFKQPFPAHTQFFA